MRFIYFLLFEKRVVFLTVFFCFFYIPLAIAQVSGDASNNRRVVIDNKPICKKDYKERRSKVIHEDYKKCVFVFLNWYISKKSISIADNKKREFFLFVDQQLQDRSYYEDEFKTADILFLIKKDTFNPEQGVLDSLLALENNLDYKKISFKKVDEELRESAIKKAISLLENISIDELNKKKIPNYGSYLNKKFDSRIAEYRKMKKPLEAEKVLTDIQSIYEGSEATIQLRYQLYLWAIDFYQVLHAFDKMLIYIDNVKKILPQKQGALLIRKINAEFILGNYNSCFEQSKVNLIESERNTRVKYTLEKYGVFCLIEDKKITLASAINNLQKLDSKISSDEHLNYKAELLIASGKLAEAERLLLSSKESYNQMRAADLISYRKDYSKAHAILQNIYVKKTLTLNERVSLFLLKYLMKNKNIKENLSLGESCSALISMAFPQNTGLVNSCQLVQKILKGESASELRKFLASSKYKNRILFRYELIESVEANL